MSISVSSILGLLLLFLPLQSCAPRSSSNEWRVEEVRVSGTTPVRYMIYRGGVLHRIQVAEKADEYAMFEEDCVVWRTGDNARAACGDHAPTKIVADLWTDMVVPANLKISQLGVLWDESPPPFATSEQRTMRHWLIPMDAIGAVARAQPPLDGARVLGRPWPVRSIELLGPRVEGTEPSVSPGNASVR